MGEGADDGLRLVVQIAAQVGARQFAFVDIQRLDAMRDEWRQSLQHLAVLLGAARVEQPQGRRLGQLGKLRVRRLGAHETRLWSMQYSTKAMERWKSFSRMNDATMSSTSYV